MEQPLFRGFSKRTNSWHYGFGWCEIEHTAEFLKDKGMTPQAILYNDSHPIECELSSMGQFTGLKDTNDKRIFDGDIVQNLRGMKNKVYWEPEILAWNCERFKDTNSRVSYLMLYELNDVATLEVIGNVYEHSK